jgi:hypothetical protein
LRRQEIAGGKPGLRAFASFAKIKERNIREIREVSD